jgi:electron transport complex protein RnfG
MAKEKKSSIIKDALILFIITIIAGVSLGFVYELTLPVIKEQELKKQTEAYGVIYPDAAEFAEDENLTKLAEEAVTKVLEPNGLKGNTIDAAFVALDASGEKIGYVMSITSGNGYGGAITLSLGYSLDGVIQGMEIISMNETPGFGAKANEPEFKEQFKGKKADLIEFTKSGASADNQIDAVSGATITTTAVTDAVNSGLRFINELVEAGN